MTWKSIPLHIHKLNKEGERDLWSWHCEAHFVFHRALLHTTWGRKRNCKLPFTHAQIESRSTEIYGVDTMKLICFSQGFATHDMGQKKETAIYTYTNWIKEREIYGVDTIKLICFSQGFATHNMGQKKKLLFTHPQIESRRTDLWSWHYDAHLFFIGLCYTRHGAEKRACCYGMLLQSA